MATAWALIVIILTSSAHSATTLAYFVSPEACTEAAQRISAAPQWNRYVDNAKPVVFCATGAIPVISPAR